MRIRVVVVNWNSFDFTDACLRSLTDAGFERGELEVVVIDNASVDGSLQRLRSAHPDVAFIANHENLGFAEACNQGMRDRDHLDAIALVNNDATVTEGWLEALCEELESDPRIGAVAAMLVLEPSFREVVVHSEDPVALVRVEVDRSDVTGRCVVRGGYDFGDPTWPLDVTRVLEGTSRLWVPMSTGARTIRIEFGPDPGHDTGGQRRVPVVSVERAVPTRSSDGGVVVVLSAGTERVDLINGLGTRRTAWGEASDIGFGEPLSAIADHVSREVDGFCGGGVLLRPAALDDVGMFDPRFFAYYEDTDLSWRMTNAGWRIVTAPDARIRHHFGGSGGSQAPWFFFLNYRNWLLTTLRNGDRGDRRQALRQLREWLTQAARANLGSRMKHRRKPSLRLVAAWVRVLAGVVVELPRLRRVRGNAIGRHHLERVRSPLQPR